MDAVGKIGEMLDLPEEVVPFSVVSLGYPAEVVKNVVHIPDKKKIHIENWGKIE